MNSKLMDQATELACDHIVKGTAFPTAANALARLVLPALPKAVAAAFKSVDLEAAVDQIRKQVARLLKNEPPDDEINGFWFGMMRALHDGDREVITLYMAGSARYDPTDWEWAVDAEWWPDDKYFDSKLLEALSAARPGGETGDDTLIENAFIEPLVLLLVAAVCRQLPPAAALGKAESRGVGAGWDEGDRNTIGVITQTGFEGELPDWLQKKRSKTTKRPAAKSTAAKPRSGKKAGTKKAGTKKAGTKKASTKKTGGKKAGRKKTAATKPAVKKAAGRSKGTTKKKR